MKASKFTAARKAFILRQGEDGTPVAEVCRNAGISQATYFKWKKEYAGMIGCTRFHGHRVKVFSGIGGRIWDGEERSHASSSLRRCG
jgi:hypothetical protein